jgi:hypothetical protein
LDYVERGAERHQSIFELLFLPQRLQTSAGRRKGDATLFAQEHQSGHATAGWGKRVASPIIRQILKERRALQASKKAEQRVVDRIHRTPGAIRVNEKALTLGYGTPDFVRRGYYTDQPFNCKDCGKEQVWTAAQQKWWYEVASAPAITKAVRCRECRRKERLRVEAARKQSNDGLQRKRRART